MDPVQKAKDILKKNMYATIATSARSAEPWNTPVLIAFDENYNFYWSSWKGAQHSQNVRENPKVFLVMFDSTVVVGAGECVYVQADASEISDVSEIERAAQLLYARKDSRPREVEEFQGEKPRRMYKAVPKKFWINLDTEIKGNHAGTRTEIQLL